MRVRQVFNNQLQQDPEWLREFGRFFNKNSNRKKFEDVKKIFVEAYLDNIREGMNPKDALQNAKSVALCFLLIQ
jgi:hypothetical protein